MRLYLAALLAGLASGPAVAAPARLVVVELFTSQGCSSCPPADAFLSELARNHVDILPLAYHVTYWNSLGWRDPYSLEAATARQYGYSRQFGGSSVFTPQMVVAGTQSLVGSDRGAASEAIAAARPDAETNLAIGLTREASGLRIHIGAGRGTGRVLLIGFDHLHRTPVGHGENGGRTLMESNIVRSIREAGAFSGAAADIGAPLPEGEDAAVIVQDGTGRILGAARL